MMIGFNFVIVINYVIILLYLIEWFLIVWFKIKIKVKKLYDVVGVKCGNMFMSMLLLVVIWVF